MSTQRNPRVLTGRHMAAIFVAFFGVVIAVNVAMARLATGTFGGVVVDNSYVASQHFNRWLDKASAQSDLGWSAQATRQPDGRVRIVLSGAPAGATLAATAWHPLGRQPDRALVFVRGADGAFVSTAPLAEGRWKLRIAAQAEGREWRAQEDLP